MLIDNDNDDDEDDEEEDDEEIMEEISDETTDPDPPEELNHAYTTPYDPQEIPAYPSEEGSLLQYPTEYDVTHSPLPAVPSLLGEDVYEDEDVETVDRELDFSNQDMEPETADEVLVLPNVVAGDESEPNQKQRRLETNPLQSAALLGLGPKISNRLSNVPQDERLAARRVDPLIFLSEEARRRRKPCQWEAYVVGSIDDSSRDPQHPEAMVWIHKHPTNEDMNASHDYTVGTAVNESRDDGVSEEEHFNDEEQLPDNSKTRDAFAQSKDPGSWSRKCYILICIGLAVLAIIIAISVVFGTKSASSNATEGPSTGGETRETQFSQHLLVGNSLADPSLLSDESSSESKAMNWIIYEDPLALDPIDP
ncbi:hypothetical protein MHU86_16190 [Fragilaria crotonensis]|nr:hypothetical protein MHU86_16190 [Fragilaria crotonensis]